MNRSSRTLALLATAIYLALVSIVGAAAPASPVAAETAVRDARRIVALNPEWSLFRASGESMDPAFGANSLLLVTKADFTAVRAGMTVVYRDAAGDLVAHRILAVEGATARARGLNNPSEDPSRVTATNLVGVVFGVLHANSPIAADSNLPLALGKTY